MEVNNVADVNIQVHISFVNGMLTNDQRKNKACGLDDASNKF
jgi:hypothetical protein